MFFIYRDVQMVPNCLLKISVLTTTGIYHFFCVLCFALQQFGASNFHVINVNDSSTSGDNSGFGCESMQGCRMYMLIS